MTREDLAFKLEGLIDAATLDDVIRSLVEVCYAKADHVESNWQDTGLAKAWTRAATRLDRITLDV